MSSMMPMRPGAAMRAADSQDVRVALLDHLDGTPPPRSTRQRWILCPWRTSFPGETGIWVSVLAAHDANGALFEALEPGRSRPDVYAAVFAVDPFRSAGEIVRRVKQSLVGGVINFPSISFIDGAAAATFESLSLGIAQELEFLRGCADAGLRVAGVVRTADAAERLLELGADFLVAHGGPPTRADQDPSLEAARRISECVSSSTIRIVPLSSVTRAGRAARSRRVPS